MGALRMFSQNYQKHKIENTPEITYERNADYDFINQKLNHGQVTIFTQGEDCQSSGRITHQTKKLLMNNNIYFKEINMKENPIFTNKQIYQALFMHSGYRSLPNIYFGREHVGGIDDLRAHFLHTSSFKRILNSNGIDISTTDSDQE